MAIAAPQEEASAEDWLIWRHAASRAHQAAEEARARARDAVAANTGERNRLRTIAPTLGRAVQSVRGPRHASRRRGALEAQRAETDAVAEPTLWTPTPASESVWTPAHPQPATLGAILEETAIVPLPAAMLLYDDMLEWLQRLHAAGATFGELTASGVLVDSDGRCTLTGSAALHDGFAGWTPLGDLKTATTVFVATVGANRTADLPLPARCLVEQIVAVESASEQLTAARLRSDLAVTTGAFLQEDWETGARAWLATAATSASVVDLLGRRRAPSDATAVSQPATKRIFSFGGLAKREPRMLVGLGIAASASLTLVVGAAVGLSGPRTPAQAVVQQHRPAITAPAPSIAPTAAAAPAAVAP
ncbi:MAG: hypothetical protein ACREN2_02795, partial [Candidatus Dormibacteria bacterium]